MNEKFYSIGNAEFDDVLLGELIEAKINFMSSEGVRVQGFEYTGTDKQGKMKYRFLEWWCPFIFDGKSII